jgi:putative hydrolase of the HAD superfamily
MRRALLFDLDETLMVEEPAAVAAFQATARSAASRYEVDVASLAAAARSRARELWHAAPTHPFCARVGISSWEGLWCRFEGSEPSVRTLRAWSATYRREAWSRALTDQRIDDVELAVELGERFAAERRARHEVFADVLPLLHELGESHPLALITNGASCLQREKLEASGLSDCFAVVAVAGEFGVGKPDASIFRHALRGLGARGEDAVMIGDSLPRDIDGASAAGLAGIWVNRRGLEPPAGRRGLLEVLTLRELPAVLSGLR